MCAAQRRRIVSVGVMSGIALMLSLPSRVEAWPARWPATWQEAEPSTEPAGTPDEDAKRDATEGAPASASPDAATEPASPGAPEPPLPRADQASGVSRPEPESTKEQMKWLPRALLFVPRWAFWTVAQPIRLSAWAYERYSLRARLKGALFNVDGTYGIYPVASYSTDFGVAGGLRFVHYDLFGADEDLKLRANVGGRFQQAYGFTIDSGDRFGDRLAVELEARYERRPSERFYGIGNSSEIDDDDVPDGMLIDPSDADVAVSTRFRETLTRVITTAEVSLLRTPRQSLALHLSGALMLRSFASPDDDDDGIAEVFDVSRLPGFTEGVDNVYVEAELIYDSRRQPSRWQSKVLDATGWYAAAHLGRGIGVAGDPSAYTRYGGELVRFFNLYRGSRVLALRLFLEAASSGDGLDDRTLPFIDLPRLGGTEYLRGYPEGRFRDRVVALGTAEYTWDLGNMLAAYMFADVGRTARTPSALDFDELRFGFGGGVQLHTQDSFVTRGQLAASQDGDVFLELVFSPAFGRRERAGRY